MAHYTETRREFFRMLREAPHDYSHGYPIVLWLSDGEPMHPTCARKTALQLGRTYRNRYEPRPLGLNAYWEGPDLQCVECGEPIESAYGDPDESETDQ